VLAGCTTNYYRNSADKETYGVIKEKTPRVRNMDPHFTIEQTNTISLDGLPVATNFYDFLGQAGERETPNKRSLAPSCSCASLGGRQLFTLHPSPFRQ